MCPRDKKKKLHTFLFFSVLQYWDPNSGLQACEADALPLEQPHLLHFEPSEHTTYLKNKCTAGGVVQAEKYMKS
jgi:hypothetical protein